MNLRSLGLAIGLACVCAVPGYAKGPKLPPLVMKPANSQDLKYPLVGRFTVIPDKDFNARVVAPQSASGATIPLWSRSLSSGYTYQMVGRNPFVAQSTQTTNISAVVIPVRLTFTSFGSTVFDPTQADGTCLSGKTAAGLLAASPLFNPVKGYPGGTYVGTGEYVDLFQRANYYTQTKPSGINPNYHVNLVRKQIPKLNLSLSGGDVVAGTCGNIGLMDINTWDSYVQNTIMPALAAESPPVAGPTTLPIFLFYNVVMYQGSTSNCCILGYHSAFSDPSYGGAFHTYANGELDSNQSFSGVSDISALSHEIAEWMDDPSGGNPTPSWGNIGQVSGCQANLEVGDPLSGTLTQIYMPSNGYTYHVQDLAFTSWFYHQNPSTGVNGWYSLLGTFLNYAAPC